MRSSAASILTARRVASAVVLPGVFAGMLVFAPPRVGGAGPLQWRDQPLGRAPAGNGDGCWWNRPRSQVTADRLPNPVEVQ
jgi:hypothetical protein